MTDAEFWTLIDRTRVAAAGDVEAQLEALASALEDYSEETIVDFDARMADAHAKACTWPLWGAAYFIGDGCSDDGFADFRGWLISRGKSAYDAALADPDSIAAILATPGGRAGFGGDGQVEGFQYLAAEAWEKVTGKNSSEMPNRRATLDSSEPSGSAWNADDELAATYPKLAAYLASRENDGS